MDPVWVTARSCSLLPAPLRMGLEMNQARTSGSSHVLKQKRPRKFRRRLRFVLSGSDQNFQVMPPEASACHIWMLMPAVGPVPLTFVLGANMPARSNVMRSVSLMLAPPVM